MNDMTQESTDQEPTTAGRYPDHLKARDALKEAGLLKYGAFIPWAALEVAIGHERGTMKFHGPLMALTALLREEEQFYLTQAGLNGTGLRIVERAEMHEIQRDRLRKQRDQNVSHARCLSLVDTSDFDPTEKMGHDRVTEQTGLTALFQHRLLNANQLPSPEQFGVTLRDILR